MLRLRPISLRDANEYVRQHHRHHKPVAGHKFSIGCEADGELVGVIIAGRPVSRYLDDGFTLEVTRLCTNGAKNACSFLYGAAARAYRICCRMFQTLPVFLIHHIHSPRCGSRSIS